MDDHTVSVAMECDPIEFVCRQKKTSLSRHTWGVFAYFRLLRLDCAAVRKVDLPDDMHELLDFWILCIPKDVVARYNFALSLREHCNVFGLDTYSSMAGRVEVFVQESVRAFATTSTAIGLLELTWPDIAHQSTLFAMTRWESIQRLFLGAALPLEKPLVDLRIDAVRRSLAVAHPELATIVDDLRRPRRWPLINDDVLAL